MNVEIKQRSKNNVPFWTLEFRNAKLELMFESEEFNSSDEALEAKYKIDSEIADQVAYVVTEMQSAKTDNPEAYRLRVELDFRTTAQKAYEQMYSNWRDLSAVQSNLIARHDTEIKELKDMIQNLFSHPVQAQSPDKEYYEKRLVDLTTQISNLKATLVYRNIKIHEYRRTIHNLKFEIDGYKLTQINRDEEIQRLRGIISNSLNTLLNAVNSLDTSLENPTPLGSEDDLVNLLDSIKQVKDTKSQDMKVVLYDRDADMFREFITNKFSVIDLKSKSTLVDMGVWPSAARETILDSLDYDGHFGGYTESQRVANDLPKESNPTFFDPTDEDNMYRYTSNIASSLDNIKDDLVSEFELRLKNADKDVDTGMQ